MIINHLENGVTEYVSEKAIVRIHPGKLSEEERKEVLKKAAVKFFMAIEQEKLKKQKTHLIDSTKE